MRRHLLTLYVFLFGCCVGVLAQDNQTVSNGQSTTAVNFPGCNFTWTNDQPGIGLAASGSGEIAPFAAVNNGTTPITATITATPVPVSYAFVANNAVPGNDYTTPETVSVINTATNLAVATVTVGVSPFAVAVTPDGKYAYVANAFSNNVSVIDATSFTVVKTISVGTNPSGILVTPDDKYVYVANVNSNNISVIATATNTVTATITVGTTPNVGPSHLVASPDSKYVYSIYDMGSASGSHITVISTSTNTVTSNIPVPAGGLADIGISPDGSKLYVTNDVQRKLYIIGTASQTLSASISVGNAPTGIAVSPDGNTIYIGDQSFNNVIVLDANTYIQTATVTVGQNPEAMAVTADGKYLYVENTFANTVSVINTATNQVVQIVKVGAGPEGFGNFISPVISCNGVPQKYTITVNPTPVAPPTITASAVTGIISACEGTASISPNVQQFTISGSNLTDNITASVPSVFEISTSPNSGFSGSVVLNQTGGTVNSTTLYVRSNASAPVGTATGSVSISSSGWTAAGQGPQITEAINALPTVNTIADQTVTNGAATAAINFSGSANNTFTWTNDTPGIGLAASGTGNIASFMAVNNGTKPVVATITATPVSNSYVYIANGTLSGTLSVINAATNKIVDTIQVGNGPEMMIMNPKYNLLYVENTGLGFVSSISVINTITNTIVNFSDDEEGPSQGMALSPDGNRLYVASISGSQQTVVVYDAQTMGWISEMDLGFSAAGIALSPDGQFLYINGLQTGQVTVVNTANNAVVKQIMVGQFPWAAATNASTGYVYVTNQGSNTVSVISIATNTVVATIPVGQSPSAISISADGTMAYIANSKSNTISVINCLTNQVIATIPVGQNPAGTSLRTDGTKLYVTNEYDNSISIIDTKTNAVINTMPIGTYPDSSGDFVSNGTGCSGAPVTFTITVNPTNAIPNQIVDNGQTTTAVNFGGSGCTYNWTNDSSSIGLVSSGSGNIASFKAVNNGTAPVVATITATPLNVSYVYVANSTDNTISAIDTKSNTVVKTIPVGTNPVNICVSPNGSKLYVANSGSNTVSIIDCATNTVVTTIPGLSSPNYVKISPDGALLYVSNFQSKSISIINTSTNQVVGQIPLSNAPLCICISPDGATLYVSSYEEEFVYQLPSNKLISSGGDAITWNFITLSKDANSMYGISYIDNFIGEAPLYNLAFGISGTSSPYAIAVGADPTQTYISNTNTNSVYEFNFTTYQITNTINVGKLPQGVFINSDYSKLYVANSGSNTISVIDTKTNLVVATIPVGNGPSYIDGFATLGDGCTPATFTITVNPSPAAPPATATEAVTGSIVACAGTPSASPQIEQFPVAGVNLTGNITATAPTNFEISFNPSSGYASTLALAQFGGSVNTVIYVRSSATAPPGAINGNVVFSSPGAADLDVGVSGTINALPTLSNISNQTYTAGSLTTGVTFAGAANTFTWSNDTPGIGLAASGSGNISPFTAINNGSTPVTATITVTPVNAGLAYIPNLDDGTVSIINTSTNTVVGKLTVGANPIAVMLSPDGTKLFVANQAGKSISVFDAATDSPIAVIPIGTSPNSFAITPDGSTLYVTNFGSNTVSVVNVSSYQLLTSITVGTGAFGIMISPDGSKVYVANQSANTVSVISSSNNTVTATIPVPNAPKGIAISPDGSLIYITNSGSNTVTVVNSATNAIAATIQVGASPFEIALSADGKTAYVTNNGSGTVSAISTADNSVLSTILVGSGPAGVALTSGSSYVYVTNENSDNVSVISTATNQVIITIPVGHLPVSVGNFIWQGSGCTGQPAIFTITVTPNSQPVISATATLAPLTTIYGTPSDTEEISVSGQSLTVGVTITPPPGFELSIDKQNFSPKVLIGGPGNINQQSVYVRLAATTPAGNNYSGNIVFSSTGATAFDLMMPAGTVNPAMLAIIADNKTKIFGAPNPILTDSFIGFVNNETVLNLARSPMLATIATTLSPAGQYPITVSGATSPNYTISFIPGTLSILPAEATLLIPNTFTPNGDGINDTWNIKELSFYLNCSVTIFTRWGQKVYSSVGYSIPWDGTYKGSALPTGTYYYIIDLNNGRTPLSGFVALVR